jgi:hypothetical protein
MRDPSGSRQLAATPPPPGSFVDVCAPLALAEAPSTPIPGDFAQHYRSIASPIPVLGLPLGPVSVEPAGDCVSPVPVLYTERQRLELHAAQAWPFRVSGTLLGTHAFARRYPGVEAAPRTDLAAPDAFADTRFRAFYEQLGGLGVFGYPISGALNEDHPETGVPTTVQYFERARFELAPGAAPGAPITEQVVLGLLGRELRDAGGAAALCGGAVTVSAGGEQPAVALAPTTQVRQAVSGDELAFVAEVLGQAANSSEWLIPVLAIAALAVSILALIGFALADWQAYRRRGAGRRQHVYRRRRTAFERFGGGGHREDGTGHGAAGGDRAAAGGHGARNQVDEDPRGQGDEGATFQPWLAEEELDDAAPASQARPMPASSPRHTPPPPDEDDELLRELLSR